LMHRGEKGRMRVPERKLCARTAERVGAARVSPPPPEASRNSSPKSPIPSKSGQKSAQIETVFREQIRLTNSKARVQTSGEGGLGGVGQSPILGHPPVVQPKSSSPHAPPPPPTPSSNPRAPNTVHHTHTRHLPVLPPPPPPPRPFLHPSPPPPGLRRHSPLLPPHSTSRTRRGLGCAWSLPLAASSGGSGSIAAATRLDCAFDHGDDDVS
jgi:hypothetical protein